MSFEEERIQMNIEKESETLFTSIKRNKRRNFISNISFSHLLSAFFTSYHCATFLSLYRDLSFSLQRLVSAILRELNDLRVIDFRLGRNG